MASPSEEKGRSGDMVLQMVESIDVELTGHLISDPNAPNEPDEAVAGLNQFLAEVMGWMRANKLKLNPDKTEVLLVGGSSSWVGDLDLALNGVALPLMDRVCNLGVLLDSELSLEAQVTVVARSAFLQLRLIHQLRPYLEDDCLATVTHALVTSQLDFCNVLYVGLPLKTVRILQMAQNRAARLLMGTGRYFHITPVLYQLHWLPIEVRAQFKGSRQLTPPPPSYPHNNPVRSFSPKMTQQMKDLQLAQSRKQPGPSSPNAAKRLYRNLSGKFRVNYMSFDEGSLAGRSEKEKLRKSYLFQGNAALFEAVELQDLEKVQELLKQYSLEELDLNTPNSEGLLPLDIAIMTNNSPIAKTLLLAGAKESPHFVSLESRSLHLSTLVREAELRVNDLTAQVVNEVPNADCSEKEKQLKAWEWRYRLYKRMSAGFEHARVPDPPTNVHLSVASSSSVEVSFQEPLSVNSAVVTKYKVEWSCSPTFSPPLGEVVINKLKNLRVTIHGLISGTAYYVQVSAYNMKGWGPPQASVPPFAIPSNWREYDGRAPRRRGQAEALDHLLNQVKMGHQHCVCHESCKNQTQSRKHSVSKSLKYLFHPGSKFLKTLKRGLYLASIFYKDDNILVTHEDQIPVVEIDDTYSCLLMQDFLWFTKVSCMWDEILWLRQCVTVSQSSCSCVLQTRLKMLLAISQMQGLLGIQDLGQVFFEPIKDKQGNILVVTLKEVKTNQTFESVRWIPLSKLQTNRKSISSPEEPTALDVLLTTMQDKLAYHQRSSQALPAGLYLGYLKLCSAVDQIRVLVPEQLPNILCHMKIRSNPNISREEWEWLQNLAHMEEPTPAEQDLEATSNLLLQELQGAIRELMQLVNIPLHEARDFRLYSQEVLDFGGQVSFLLLLPPSDDVCTAPGQNNPYAPRSGFLTLPLQIFELVHFFTYDHEFISQYCQVSALLELESLLSQQSLREAFSDSELTTAKQRHQQVQDYIQQMEEIWREMRWMMDALQHARYKQPSCGIPLMWFIEESSATLKEKTSSASSHMDFLPSPMPSPEMSRKLNSGGFLLRFSGRNLIHPPVAVHPSALGQHIPSEAPIPRICLPNLFCNLPTRTFHHFTSLAQILSVFYSAFPKLVPSRQFGL
ncbi:Ankyrin repeat and fibronectin type-III domain-containing protein 1 [Varanus komodoensis]|nr:Ankyrin repeat and fibronectin type-III domain-containing protein 1 [Varanus komodoensis]